MKIINKLLRAICSFTGGVVSALKTQVYALPPPPLLAVSPVLVDTRTKQIFITNSVKNVQ